MLTIIERWLARRFLHRHRREGKGFGYPTIIIGSPESIHDTIVQLRNSKSLGYIPIAVCPVKASAGNTPNAPRRLLSVPFTADDSDEAELIALPLDSHLPITAKYLKAQTVLIADVLTRDSENHACPIARHGIHGHRARAAPSSLARPERRAASTFR